MTESSNENNGRRNQLIAWVVLFFLVWIIGSSFLSAMSSTNLSSNVADPTKTPTGSASTGASSTISVQPVGKTASPSPANTIGRVEVLQSGLNLRTEARRGDNVIKQLGSGTVLSVTEKSENWYGVWVNGDVGYVSSSPSFIKVLEMKE